MENKAHFIPLIRPRKVQYNDKTVLLSNLKVAGPTQAEYMSYVHILKVEKFDACIRKTRFHKIGYFVWLMVCFGPYGFIIRTYAHIYIQ